jgi:hypothetical protein
MYIVLQRFLQNEGKMGTFGAITKIIGAFVIAFCDGNIKKPLGFLYLLTDFWKESYPKRGAILFDHFHQRYVVKKQLTILNFKLFGGEIEGLFNQIEILIFHFGRGLAQ